MTVPVDLTATPGKAKDPLQFRGITPQGQKGDAQVVEGIEPDGAERSYISVLSDPGEGLPSDPEAEGLADLVQSIY